MRLRNTPHPYLVQTRRTRRRCFRATDICFGFVLLVTLMLWSLGMSSIAKNDEGNDSLLSAIIDDSADTKKQALPSPALNKKLRVSAAEGATSDVKSPGDEKSAPTSSTSVSIPVILAPAKQIKAAAASPSLKTHWCVITRTYIARNPSKHFHHFPHAAETLLPCWSYFYEQGLTDSCGIELRLGKHTLSSWNRELIEDAMGCKIMSDENPGKKGDIGFKSNLYHMRPRFEYISYLNSPEHAHALRRNIISDDDIAKVKGKGKPFQIGMIQRPESRHIDNLQEIRDAIQVALPDAQIDMTDFKFTTMKEQAWYFASKDLIIAAHGAALTNSIFITPKTIVLQLHSSGYYYPSLEPLIEQAGGIAMDWHNKTDGNPYVKYATIPTMEKNEARDAHLVVPPEDVVERVLYGLGVKEPTRKEINALYGDAWTV